MSTDSVKITLPSGEVRDFPRGTSPVGVLKELRPPGRFLAATVNGLAVDLNSPIEEDATLAFVEAATPQGLEILRHSAAHVMAQAILDLYPETLFAIGPSIDNGFYYDIDTAKVLGPEDIAGIEKKMREIVKADQPFERTEMDRNAAIELFRERGDRYKVELLEGIEAPTVSLYRQGSFLDLCRGPHIPSTGKIKAFKLMSLAGAYWRGDERNKMLQRIYGTAFDSKEKLEEYLHLIEEAKLRDHRKLGKELGLFSIHDEVGAGLPIYHPRGALLRSLLEDFEKKEHLKRGYLFARGPEILRTSMWELSGHLDNYRQNMYFTEIDGESYGIKPMNCLAHMLIYKSSIRSYRDLPLRYFELGTVHRHEKSGVLHGLLRVREFTQDDAHILCTPEQVGDEIKGVIDFVDDVMRIFKFDYTMEVSTRPEKSIGSDEDWERATAALIKALDDKKLPYTVHDGEGAFYGPKIDVKLKDALHREWQCATIQCDFTLPERFDLTYIGPDGQRHRPVMLHRVILGSLERFISVLIEHYAGAFPLWLSPLQVMVMNITDAQADYVAEVHAALWALDIRAEKDLRNEKLGFKIREAQLAKTPYMLVVGDEEKRNKTLSVRSREEGTIGSMTLDAFISLVEKRVKDRT